MPLTYFAHWWAWMLRGVLAILFGIFALVTPGLTLALLILIFGIWAFVDGATHLSVALRPKSLHPWLHGVEGVIGMATGVAVLFHPVVAIFTLVYLIAAWAILLGITRATLSFQLHAMPPREWFMILSSAIAVIFGLVLALDPSSGAIAISLWIGIYAIVVGVVLFGLSLHMRGMHRALTRGL